MIDDHSIVVVGQHIAAIRHPSGRALPRLLETGVPVILGSDYSPPMTATPFDMIHAALEIYREIAAADNAGTLEQALAMATNPGVTIGRPGEVGQIAVGQFAELVLIDTSGAHHLGTRHPSPHSPYESDPATSTQSSSTTT